MSENIIEFPCPSPEERETVECFLKKLQACGLVDRWRILPESNWVISFSPDYLDGVGGRAALLAFVTVLGDLAGEAPLSELDQAMLQGLFHPESAWRVIDLRD